MTLQRRNSPKDFMANMSIHADAADAMVTIMTEIAAAATVAAEVMTVTADAVVINIR